MDDRLSCSTGLTGHGKKVACSGGSKSNGKRMLTPLTAKRVDEMRVNEVGWGIGLRHDVQ